MRRAAVVFAPVGLVVLLSGCIGPMGQGVSNLFFVAFSQSQAIPDFDDTVYELEATEVDDFRELLTEFNIDPGDYTSPDTAGCTGGLSTHLDMSFYGGGGREVTIDSCGRDDDSFEVAANAFFTAWRDTHTVDGGLPNDDILYLTFSQSQAIEGFDDAEYKQRLPVEIRRFRDLLDEYGIQASTYEPPLSESCEGGLTTTVSAEYLNTKELLDLVFDDCTVDDGFTAAANDLFTEWRETLSAES